MGGGFEFLPSVPPRAPGLACQAGFLAATKLRKWVNQGELHRFNVRPGAPALAARRVCWFLGLPRLVKSCPGSPRGETEFEPALQAQGKNICGGSEREFAVAPLVDGEKDVRRFTSTREPCTAGQTTAADSLDSNYALFLPILPSLQRAALWKVSLPPGFDGSQMEACQPFLAFVFLEETQALFAEGRGTAVFPRAARVTVRSGRVNRVLAAFERRFQGRVRVSLQVSGGLIRISR